MNRGSHAIDEQYLSLKDKNYSFRCNSKASVREPERSHLIDLPEDVSEICKSALFEMTLRCCMRRLKDASEMHPCRLGYICEIQEQLFWRNNFFFWIENRKIQYLGPLKPRFSFWLKINIRKEASATNTLNWRK